MQKQQGFTLLEVMIAAFVLSVGMLGSTSMLLRSLQQANETNKAAIVVQSAQNMAERMRGNIEALENLGSYNNLVADSTTPVDCSAYCTPANVALYHAYIWGMELENLLPNANPTATVTSLTPGSEDSVYNITINWDAAVDQGDGVGVVATETYVMIFQP